MKHEDPCPYGAGTWCICARMRAYVCVRVRVCPTSWAWLEVIREPHGCSASFLSWAGDLEPAKLLPIIKPTDLHLPYHPK
jgi:hypothetical protein